ncbi:flagellar hook-basal body protein [Paenibacillus sp. UMB4589-SE434]|uniref:flagellar hook-basal body protein n=1 Tax=Paenibacillus sp. UMB4589-SE434 TaxID=3046314 RepID=UPI00254B916E|nr:flagellar hook-basal body protein [Paenibacillus sp. UMB4589-SE434]MDK8181603.1 flagellar hook-basal body protein [Paenibacillus sp. UMB4589-SE434]
MNNSIIAASVSMSGLQRKLDVIADNVANVDTRGFKRKTASFADVLTNAQQQNRDFKLPGRATPLGFTNGYGSMMTGIGLDFSQGSLLTTNVPTDLAIEGNGLFEVRTPEGTAFVREGDFHMVPTNTGEALLTTRTGAVVTSTDDSDIRIRVQEGYQMKIDAAGRVYEVKPSTNEQILVGTLKLVQAIKPELLQKIDNNMYVIPPTVDRNTVLQTLDLTNIPPDGKVPLTVRQGVLESSNVSLGDEMSELIQAQRAYQMSARALSSGDAMWGLANSMRG